MEQSFSVDTGGGGRESNIHLIPYIIHTVLYVLNTSVSFSSNLFLPILIVEKAIKGSSLGFVHVCGKKGGKSHTSFRGKQIAHIKQTVTGLHYSE